MPKVYIAICSCRDWKPQFGTSVARMLHETGIGGTEIFLNSLQGTSVLPRARQLVLEDAINGQFSHALLLDDDMKFPPRLLRSFLKHDLPIVGANYARKDGSGSMMACGMDGKPVKSRDNSGIEEIGWIPFGAILINLEAIRDMPKPWFEVRWLEERKDFMGEDYYFSMKARTHGLKLFVDHDVSNETRHIGDCEYKEAA